MRKNPVDLAAKWDSRALFLQSLETMLEGAKSDADCSLVALQYYNSEFAVEPVEQEWITRFIKDSAVKARFVTATASLIAFSRYGHGNSYEVFQDRIGSDINSTQRSALGKMVLIRRDLIEGEVSHKAPPAKISDAVNSYKTAFKGFARQGVDLSGAFLRFNQKLVAMGSWMKEAKPSVVTISDIRIAKDYAELCATRFMSTSKSNNSASFNDRYRYLIGGKSLPPNLPRDVLARAQKCQIGEVTEQLAKTGASGWLKNITQRRAEKVEAERA